MDIDRGVLALVATKLGLHALSVGVFAYGYMGDETYYLACADHLSWGYVDHPPLSIGLLWAVRGILGDSLPALRLVPAVAGALTVLLVATMARDLGGGRLAQRIAALATLTAPAYLTIGGYWSMNSLDLLLWTVALLLVVRLVQGGGQRVWVGLGVTLALALLDKLSALWLGGALWVGILATPHRTWLTTRGPWLASAIAALGLVPYGLWQVANGWPTLAFIHNGSVDKLLHVGPLGFLGSQILILGPLNAPLWFAGLLTLLAWRPYRILAFVWLLVCGLLIVHGNVRAYYLAAAYPPLLAAGAVLVERLSVNRRWVGRTVAAVIGITGVITAPLALPLLPVDRYLAYAAAIGLSAPVEQAEARTTPMPLHFAAQLSGPPIARGVAEAWRGLADADRARVTLLAQTYTEASAIDFFGPDLGLPRAISYRNAYWTWGPTGLAGPGFPCPGNDESRPGGDCVSLDPGRDPSLPGRSPGPGDPRDVFLIPADPEDEILERFGVAEQVAAIDCPLCLSHVSRHVYLCRDPVRPLEELWPELQEFK